MQGKEILSLRAKLRISTPLRSFRCTICRQMQSCPTQRCQVNLHRVFGALTSNAAASLLSSSTALRLSHCAQTRSMSTDKQMIAFLQAEALIHLSAAALFVRIAKRPAGKLVFFRRRYFIFMGCV